jgi:PAS domain S-box-containing protein
MPRKRTVSKAQALRDRIFSQAPGLEAAEALFDAINDVLYCVKDRDRRYVTVNDAFVRRAGMRNRSELIGRTAGEVFPAILAAGYEQMDDEVFAKGETVRDRIELITQASGGMGWFVAHKTPVRNLSGEVIALAGISRDLGDTRSDLGALANIVDTLHRDYGQPLRIEGLASQSGLSWSQFQRRVRSITGLTPRQLLTKTRIEAAAQSLIKSNKPLSAIATECGFYDQAAFSRQFRASTGLTPSDYRSIFHRSGV